LMLSVFDTHLTWCVKAWFQSWPRLSAMAKQKTASSWWPDKPSKTPYGYFLIARNIAFNNSLEFYLTRLVEMVSDLLDVERCSIFYYDGVKDSLFCKVITGRLREPIIFKRES
jgi:hypothetical protein